MERIDEIKKIVCNSCELEEEILSNTPNDAIITKIIKSKKKIILAEDIVSKMTGAMNATLTNGYENGFFIYGKEISPGVVIFFESSRSRFEKGRLPELEKGEIFEGIDCLVSFELQVKNIKELEKLYNNGVIDMNTKYLLDISLMGRNCLYEALMDGIYRELPDGTRSVDSIIHFHTHNNVPVDSGTFTTKDLLMYSYLFPSILDSLSAIGERTDINFYGTLMCPKRVDSKNGIIRLYTIESLKDNDYSDLDFEISTVPMYQLSYEGDKLELINSKLFYKYTTYDDNTLNDVDKGAYLKDVTNTSEGKNCLDKIKKYVKKIR